VSARAFSTGVAPTLMPLRLAGGGRRLGSRRRRGRRSREDRHVQAAVAITHHLGTHLSVDGATPPISRSNTARTQADLGVDNLSSRDFTEGAAPSSHPGTTFAALGRDSRASALAGRSSVDRLVFVAA
jgi:hypothetical protein